MTPEAERAWAQHVEHLIGEVNRLREKLDASEALVAELVDLTASKRSRQIDALFKLATRALNEWLSRPRSGAPSSARNDDMPANEPGESSDWGGS